MNSLTKEAKEAKDVITIWEDNYRVYGLPSGNLLLRVIVRESHIDTNATKSSTRTKLSNFDTYMIKINSALAARGKTSDDILTNLFKG